MENIKCFKVCKEKNKESCSVFLTIKRMMSDIGKEFSFSDCNVVLERSHDDVWISVGNGSSRAAAVKFPFQPPPGCSYLNSV